MKISTIECKVRKKETINIFLYFIDNQLITASAKEYRLK